eukprot:m.17796 g.17796  ORF g.17796 m.17796 type:complete len:334 (-) comp7577_c0_seq1:279-1280(-)
MSDEERSDMEQSDAELEDVEDEEVEEEEEEEEEEDEPVDPKELTKEMIASKLDLVSKVGSGLDHAFVRLNVASMELTDAAVLESYRYLRYVDASNNFLTDASSFYQLPELLSLTLKGNRISSVQLPAHKYLQRLDLSFNRIKVLESEIKLPLLVLLSLEGNKLKDASMIVPENLPQLQHLILADTRIKSLPAMHFENLTLLNISNTPMKTVEGIGACTKLQTLVASGSAIQSFAGFSDKMIEVQEIVADATKVEEVAELAHLSCLPKLAKLTCADSPISEQSDYRVEALVCVESLVSLDGDEYEQEEFEEATRLRMERASEEAESVQVADDDE